MKKLLGIFLVAAFGAAAGAGVITLMIPEAPATQVQPIVRQTTLSTSTGANVVETPNFIGASAAATPAVVHIKSTYEGAADRSNDPWSQLFGGPLGGPGGKRQSAGSGVIISQDGFIATNNHVIDDADEIEVVLNDKRTFSAELVGNDPTTDLALLKIEEAGLPFLEFGNSNGVEIGEWVLAVGNPFNLTSTVTAGIVSAKGRNLNLLRDQTYSIESFIQTDAAVNPGNSGGALINTKGELIGINTAIASETGSYAGYSFAVPANLVKKIMADLKEFGQVQKGILGVQIRDINQELAEENGLKTLDGVYIDRVLPSGAAGESGLQSGDVIVSIDNIPVANTAELQEVIGQRRPGDAVAVTYFRGSGYETSEVVLRNLEGTTKLVARSENVISSDKLGAELALLTPDEKREMGIQKGVKVEAVNKGLLRDMGIDEGFVITRVNKKPVDDVKDVEKALEIAEGRMMIEGLNKEGVKEFHSYGF